MMLRAGLFAVVAIGASVTSALGSGTIDCASPDGEATVHLSIGSLPVLAVIGAEVTTADHRFTLTSGEGGAQEDATQPVIVGQAFQDDRHVMIDFTDPNVETVLASLRLFHATEERDGAMAGTLVVTGIGAWSITCIGP